MAGGEFAADARAGDEGRAIGQEAAHLLPDLRERNRAGQDHCEAETRHSLLGRVVQLHATVRFIFSQRFRRKCGP